MGNDLEGTKELSRGGRLGASASDWPSSDSSRLRRIILCKCFIYHTLFIKMWARIGLFTWTLRYRTVQDSGKQSQVSRISICLFLLETAQTREAWTSRLNWADTCLAWVSRRRDKTTSFKHSSSAFSHWTAAKVENRQNVLNKYACDTVLFSEIWACFSFYRLHEPFRRHQVYRDDLLAYVA